MSEAPAVAAAQGSKTFIKADAMDSLRHSATAQARQIPTPPDSAFDRSRLPDPISYFENQGFALTGRGKWRTTRCDFHGGSDSMRVNSHSGGWCCMACGAKGGDVLAFHMQHLGLDFVQAARDLGCWTGANVQRPRAPAGLSAADALELAAFELQLAMIVLSDARRGVLPPDPDWQRFLQAAGRVQMLAQGAQ
ncbi:CHC2 zinc finger domain-containing protein [Inhella proteolytica]|nr:CHC2 zinc finger domain-containing protein [Inhella proteolytica]